MLKCFKWIVLLSTQHVPLHTIKGGQHKTNEKGQVEVSEKESGERFVC